MRHVLLPFALGLASPIVLILGAEPFGDSGADSPRVLVAGEVAVALYFAACHLWCLRSEWRTPRAAWLVPLAMLLAVVLMTAFISVVERGQQWLYAGLPMFIGGCVGAAGATIARYMIPALRRGMPLQ